MADEKQPSAVIPVLVAVLICDAAVAEAASGKKSLVGIFDKVFALKLPASRPACIYVKLADAEGYYRLVLRLVHLNSGRTLAEAHAEFEVRDRLGSVDGISAPVPLPLPELGRYELQVHANDVYLGSATLDVVAFTSSGGV